MRKYARELAVYRVRPVADQIIDLWNTAVASEQPGPNSVACIQMIVRAGFRVSNLNVLHGCLDDCRR